MNKLMHTTCWSLGVLLILCVSGRIGAQSTYQRVPLLRLLVAADENTVDGMHVSVVGYLSRRGELFLYLTKDHAEILDKASGVPIADTVWLEIDQSSCSSYVLIMGVVARDRYSSGVVLTEIQEVRQADTQELCWRRSAN